MDERQGEHICRTVVVALALKFLESRMATSYHADVSDFDPKSLKSNFCIFSYLVEMFTPLRKAGSLARVMVTSSISRPFLTHFQIASVAQRRFLSIHEYQSVKLLNDVQFIYPISYNVRTYPIF